MQLFVKDQAALLTAFGKELIGYTPGEKYDASKWKFPVLLELDGVNKTFVLVQEEATKPSTKKETTEAPAQEVTESKSTKSKLVKLLPVIAASIVGVVIVAVIIYNIVK